MDYDINKQVTYLSSICENNFILMISKSGRIARKTSTIIDNIPINAVPCTSFETMIFKIYISDHFLICFLLATSTVSIENKYTFITKNIINSDAITKSLDS